VLLASYDGPEPERVRRAIVALTGGDARLVRRWLETARVDYRDVLRCEEQARTGRSGPAVDVEGLTAWLEAGADPHGAGPAGRATLVLVDAGASGPDLLKAVRAVSGLGLAEVVALVERTPVTLVVGVTEEEAAEGAARLTRLGATVEVQRD
jgi:ribosomal protein L7/L12